MNYKALDRKIMWNFKNDLYKACKEMGYDYISEAVIDLYREGYSTEEIADKFGTTRHSVNRWKKRWDVILEVS